MKIENPEIMKTEKLLLEAQGAIVIAVGDWHFESWVNVRRLEDFLTLRDRFHVITTFKDANHPDITAYCLVSEGVGYFLVLKNKIEVDRKEPEQESRAP